MVLLLEQLNIEVVTGELEDSMQKMIRDILSQARFGLASSL